MRDGRLQEVTNIVVWLGNFWYFGKLVAEERWSQQEVRLCEFPAKWCPDPQAFCYSMFVIPRQFTTKANVLTRWILLFACLCLTMYIPTKSCILVELIYLLMFVTQVFQHHHLLQQRLQNSNVQVAPQALLTWKRSVISAKTAKTTQTKHLVAGHVTSRMTCVAGLIPILTTLTGNVKKAVLEALIQVLVWMRIKVPMVIIVVLRALKVWQ